MPTYATVHRLSKEFRSPEGVAYVKEARDIFDLWLNAAAKRREEQFNDIETILVAGFC